MGESVEDGVVESLAFRGDTIEARVRVRDLVLSTGYSLERPRLSVGDRLKVLIYRLYAFHGDQAILVQNRRLGNDHGGYEFHI
jgi:sulfate transport system ATP-binding protein